MKLDMQCHLLIAPKLRRTEATQALQRRARIGFSSPRTSGGHS